MQQRVVFNEHCMYKMAYFFIRPDGFVREGNSAPTGEGGEGGQQKGQTKNAISCFVNMVLWLRGNDKASDTRTYRAACTALSWTPWLSLVAFCNATVAMVTRAHTEIQIHTFKMDHGCVN